MNVIYKTIPKHTEEGISVDQVLEVYFMIDMNKNTFRPENIILFNLTEQLVEPVEYEYNRRILKVTPLGDLSPNNHYQLQLIGGSKGLLDITGRSMAQTYEVEFYTKDVQGIKPPIILAPTDVSVSHSVVTFQLQPELDVDYYELQISKSNTFHNLVWPINGEKVYRTPDVSVTPDVAYETGLYYMRVRSVGFDSAVSSWSSIVRYFYDGAPIIHLPEEEPLPDEVIPPVEIPSEDVVVASVRKVILQATSQVREPENQLSKLQQAFSTKEVTTLTGMYVKSATPKDKSVNNPLAKVNQLVIEFTDDIDPASVDETTCYILSERN